MHSALAHFYQLQGDIEKAKQAYLQAIKLDDKQGDVYNNFGAFLCGQGEFEQAYSQFNAALAAPNYYHQADTYENMALCALPENKPMFITKHWRNCAKLILPERKSSVRSNNHCQKPLSTLKFGYLVFYFYFSIFIPMNTIVEQTETTEISFGDKLRQTREALNLSLEDVAKAISLRPSILAKLENNEFVQKIYLQPF